MTQIVNQEDYKLDVDCVELRNNTWQLTITRYIEGYGTTTLELFLTEDELAAIRHTINAGR